MARILIIDDDDSVGVALRQVFEYEGHRVHLAPDGPSGLIDHAGVQPDVTFLDVKMPRMDGVEVLERMRKADPAAVVVMISGHATIGTAVEATRKGAFDFLEKPLDTDRLLVTLRNALTVRGLCDSLDRLADEVEVRHGIVGASKPVKAVLRAIEKVGATAAPVLVTGENGTGKELAARALHRRSDRALQPFVEVNCAAIPGELIESELFGHAKGSFSGAIADRTGRFEQAHRGTLFLDEVADMSLPAQAKVLRALQGEEITPVGSARSVAVDARIVAATNKDLREEIAGGRFREDLLHRLNMVTIRVPALRERREDVPMLVAHFAERAPESYGVPFKSFGDGALEALAALDWPGNVRELKNAVGRLMILSRGDVVRRRDVERLVALGTDDPTGFVDTAGFESLRDFKDAAERTFILETLRDEGWNVSRAAKRMRMPRSNLYRKMERHGLARD